MRQSACSMLFTMMFCGVVAAPISLWGRACSGTTDFQGAYGFVGAPLLPSTSSAAASSGSSVSLASPISMLVQAASKGQSVAAVGTLVSDGGGNLLAPAVTGTGFLNVGTYSVNSDCSISATLIDAYNYTN